VAEAGTEAGHRAFRDLEAPLVAIVDLVIDIT
jgi:hypothetical protein